MKFNNFYGKINASNNSSLTYYAFIETRRKVSLDGAQHMEATEIPATAISTS